MHIRQGKLSWSAVDRITIPQHGVVALGDCPPESVVSEKRDHVIVVMLIGLDRGAEGFQFIADVRHVYARGGDFGVRFLKIRSGTSGSPTNQTEDAGVVIPLVVFAV